MTNKYHCDSCEADFTIKHQMDESFFEVSICPFCGSELDHPDEDEVEEFE